MSYSDPSFDPDELERRPEMTLRRREFLQRTAMGAGLAASSAAVLRPDLILAQAAQAASRRALPSPRNMPIDTFVVLMMENRSFDHYLGWLPGADGRQGGLTFTDLKSANYSTHRLQGIYQGCGFLDPDHSWDGGRTEVNGGKMDGFLRADSDVFAAGYYDPDDIPFTPTLARNFTAFDRYFASALGPTQVNREYMHAAQSYGTKVNPDANSILSNGFFPDTTIFASLAAAGVSNRYYYSDLPVSAFWGPAGIARSSPVDQFYSACESGTLPKVSFVDPTFNGEGDGTSGDEHPFGDIRTGQAFISDVVHAFMESPQWKTGALFIVYDEWGGFFDHVAPPRVPDDRASKNPADDFAQMGVRVPATAVSPYLRRGYVDHGIYGHESILKMISYRFGLPALTRRHQYARNIAKAFDFASKPNYEIPDMPRAPAVASGKCSTSERELDATIAKSQVQASDAVPHDELFHIVTDPRIEKKLGFKYSAATPSRIFRAPSSMGYLK